MMHTMKTPLGQRLLTLLAASALLLLAQPAHALFTQTYLLIQITPSPEPNWVSSRLPAAPQVSQASTQLEIPGFAVPTHSLSLTPNEDIFEEETLILPGSGRITFLPEE